MHPCNAIGAGLVVKIKEDFNLPEMIFTHIIYNIMVRCFNVFIVHFLLSEATVVHGIWPILMLSALGRIVSVDNRLVNDWL